MANTKESKSNIFHSIKTFVSSKTSSTKVLIFFILLLIIFFSFSIVITYDSTHYISYVEIFEGISPFSSWDIARGPVFPLVIYWSNSLFGKSPQGLLICMFLFYSLYVITIWQILSVIFSRSKPQTFFKWLLFLFAIFNPIIFGYAHTLLTEFISIPLCIVSIFMAWKLYTGDKIWPYVIYFTLAVPFSWELKQPYICLTIIPLLVSLIFSFFLNKTRAKKLNFVAFLLPLISLAICYFSWNLILSSHQISTDSDRSSSGMLSTQLNQTFSDNIFVAISKNICAISSVCVIESDDGVHYEVTTNIDLLNTFENNVIPYRLYVNGADNTFSVPSDNFAKISLYYQTNSPSIARKGFQILQIPTNIIYKISILVLPFITLIMLIFYFFTHKDKAKASHLFVLLAITNITVILTLIADAFVSLIIDRYSVELFIPSLISFAGTIKLLYLHKHKPSPNKRLAKRLRTI